MTDYDIQLFDPTARITDPPTSHKAAKRAAVRAPSTRTRVLHALYLADTMGLTDFELSDLIKSPQTSCGVRRGELCKVGQVAARTGSERPSPSGSPAQVWIITAAGVAAYEASQS